MAIWDSLPCWDLNLVNKKYNNFELGISLQTITTICLILLQDVVERGKLFLILSPWILPVQFICVSSWYETSWRLKDQHEEINISEKRNKPWGSLENWCKNLMKTGKPWPSHIDGRRILYNFFFIFQTINQIVMLPVSPSIGRTGNILKPIWIKIIDKSSPPINFVFLSLSSFSNAASCLYSSSLASSPPRIDL